MILCRVSSGTGSLFKHRHAVATSSYTIKLFHSTPCRPDAANRCKSARLLVPTLGQNSTLLLRSKSPSLSQIQIVPQWRDDTLLELVQDTSEEPNITDISTATAESSTIVGGVQLTFHKDGIDTSMGRIGSFVEVDLLDTAGNIDNDDSPWKLIATVPEKCNITCQIANGDINVDGKLEGDVHLSTSKNGNITVGKLRGHNVMLSNTNQIEGADYEQNKGLIHIKKAVEARTVVINSSQRVRARMINGQDIQIQVNPSTMFTCRKLDEDDEGAIIDVGSLYISHGAGESEANLAVDATYLNASNACRGVIRVKSNHGHVTINAKVNHTVSKDTPLIDLGSVNGSCDVLLQALTSSDFVKQSSAQERGVASRIHFDAFAPESISTTTSRGNVGDISITIDRKLDAELRLLSMAKSNATMPSDIDAHSIASDEFDDMNAVMQGLDEHLKRCINDKQASDDDILIETDAFHMSDDTVSSPSPQVQYIQGTIKNRSGEPESRFDIQSRGKINKDGAALQALHGFHSKTTAGDADGDNASQHPSVVLPLLSVVTDGKIKVETLSWLGSIARRYGLEENKKIALGRQASRKSSDRVNFLTKK